MDDITVILERARAFKKRPMDRPRGDKFVPLDPLLKDSPSVQQAIQGMMERFGCAREVAEDTLMRARNCGEILTPEELAGRLKVPISWIYAKQRARCKNPIPSKPMGRYVRFDWDQVVAWLENLSNTNGTNSNTVRSRKKRT